MNSLTERLLAEGYTKDNHPDYVVWSHWNDFEYTQEYLAGSVWESPCGLLKKGIHDYNNGSHMGVTYCPENNNPRYGCPHYDEKPCPHRFDTKLWGWNCAFHQTTRVYDYENSVEKLWGEWNKIEHKAWKAATANCGHCACMEWDRPSRSFLPNYQVERCMSSDCQNEVCAITKQCRKLEKVNIYYDVLRKWQYKKGFLEYSDHELEKGVKKFKKAVARTDAEAWLQFNADDLKRPKSRLDCRDEYFSTTHGAAGFGDYDYYHFEIAVQNVRIERRESRDLAQDLADIAEGIKVVHASDAIKQQKQDKRNRKLKRQEAKSRKQEALKIQNWIACVNDESQKETLRNFCRRELDRRGISYTPLEKPMQLTLWD